MRRWVRIALAAWFYFCGVYFAVAALEPRLAWSAAWFAVLLAMLIYLFLDATKRSEEGLAMALFYVLPFTCVVAGLFWWLLRLLKIWTPLIK